MKRVSFHLIRIGLGITFLWIGVLIIRNPVAWGGYIQPWAAKLLPMPIEQVMIGTGILDMAIGALLLINFLTWLVALIAALHLISVLVVSGITDITVRDIAILYCALAITVETLPEPITSRFPFLR